LISRRSVYFRLDWDCQSILGRYLASYNECLTPMLTSVEFLQEMEESRTIPRPLVGRCDWWWRDKVMADFLFSIW